jgi:hypothetical protein
MFNEDLKLRRSGIDSGAARYAAPTELETMRDGVSTKMPPLTGCGLGAKWNRVMLLNFLSRFGHK